MYILYLNHVTQYHMTIIRHVYFHLCCSINNKMEMRQSNDNSMKAWNEKEKLLRYDREHAQRTTILDDQEDYYTSTTWLTQEEQDQYHHNENIRSNQMQHRTNITMNLDL